MRSRKNGSNVITNTVPKLNFSIQYRTSDSSLQHAVADFVREWLEGKQQFEVQTSGSTGPPKTIVLQREQLEASAMRTLNYFGLQPGNTTLLGISPATIGGKMMIVRSIIGKLRLVVASPSSDPLKVLEPEETLDFCPMVPLQAQFLLKNRPEDFKRIRTILFGGAPLSASTEKQLIRFHEQCFLGFGMTETVSHVALRKLGEEAYTALPGVRFAVSDQNLVITDMELKIDRLRTNDQVNLLDETHFIWLGRTDFVINSGGVKLYPEQIEHILSAIIYVPFFIASEPDDTFGEKCIIVVDETTEIPPLDEIQRCCKKHLGAYSAPRKCYITPIVFSNGTKINRRATLLQLGIGA